MKAGTTAPGRPIKSRGGFIAKCELTAAEYDATQKVVHAAAWTAFVAKHGRAAIAKSAQRWRSR